MINGRNYDLEWFVVGRFYFKRSLLNLFLIAKDRDTLFILVWSTLKSEDGRICSWILTFTFAI